jgi:NIPSNAP
LFTLLLLNAANLTAQNKQQATGYYQITIYHFADSLQAAVLHQYLQKAYLPALHRQSIGNIGVFEPITNDTAASKQLYVIVPLTTLDQLNSIKRQLAANSQYLKDGQPYLDAVYTNPPYNRMETILLEPFHLAPFFSKPDLKSSYRDKIYELRSYESASEKIFANKVRMFNEGDEIGIFKSLNFNAVFYGSVIAGSHMPNLMYMTSFENMEERNKHWKQFGDAPAWKALSALPEYQNNVSKIYITFMKATAYSDY